MLNTIFPCSGLSCEVLYILVAQGATKLPKVKVGGLKKRSGRKMKQAVEHAIEVEKRVSPPMSIDFKICSLAVL